MVATNLIPDSEREPASTHPNGEGCKQKIISSAELFDNQREILIRHGDDLYRLRITRTGKLILNK